MRVLVAVDTSAMAERVVSQVAPWLRAVKAEVELLTVLDASEWHSTLSEPPDVPAHGWVSVGPTGGALPTPQPAPRVVEYESQALDEVRAERLAGLEALARRHLAGIAARFRVAEADEAAEEILRVAGEIEADAIALGTQGRSGIERVFMGNVAEHVIRGARVTLLLVPTPHAA